MIVQLAAFVGGVFALYYGAEWLVAGASRIAHALGVSPLVVGLTVVALGTSSPELAVSMLAALAGNADVAIGNIVGSNIANLGLILGFAALIQPMAVPIGLLKRDVPVMIGAAVSLPLMALDLEIGRLNAAVLLAGMLVYSSVMIRVARRHPEPVLQELEVFEAKKVTPQRTGRDIVLVLAGLVVLAAGGKLLVESATYFARLMGVSDLVIGLTVVAIGTSLPELATSTLAAIRGHADIAVGNVVGSNIANILFILGATAAVRPVAADPALLAFEIPVMVGITLVFLPLAMRRLRIERSEAALLLAGYILFIYVLLERNAPPF